MAARRWLLGFVASIAAVSLAGCGGGTTDAPTPSTTTTSAPTASATTSAPTTEPAAVPAAPIQTSPPESNASVPVEAERCTNRIDYAGDPRSNAEINSIGESTGVCPQPIAAVPSPEPVPDDRCTNRIDYAGDPRSNAEINSIGEATGACPAPIPS